VKAQYEVEPNAGRKYYKEMATSKSLSIPTCVLQILLVTFFESRRLGGVNGALFNQSGGVKSTIA